MKVLSGIQPSGSLHIGNYFGMMKRMIEYQESHDLFVFIVNYHALTTVANRKVLSTGTLEAALDFLALGLDPDKTIFWVQSDVPEVTELTWILSNVTPMGLLERCHAFKDKVAKGLGASHGLFAYPVLMAADILLYQAELVPVGGDQKQHVEVARDIAQKFNHTFGETFVLPEPAVAGETGAVPGVDGQKMSKSYDNTLGIFSEEKMMRKKVMRIITDSTPVEEPKDPDKCTVFALYKLFATEAQIEEMAGRYRAGGMGYAQAKEALFELMWAHFKPYHEKRKALAEDMEGVRNILRQGADKARFIANKTLNKARRKTGLVY